MVYQKQYDLYNRGSVRKKTPYPYACFYYLMFVNVNVHVTKFNEVIYFIRI